MRRILILGCAGSGKSTLSQRLSEITGIEVVHLDALYWKPGWIGPDQAEWEAKLRSAIDAESWIMDGNYSTTLPQRLQACDTAVFLDFPRLTCLWRVIWRSVRYLGRTRPDMPAGCPERLELEFLKWIWLYPRRTRPNVLALLNSHRGTKNVVHLTKSRDVQRFIEKQSLAIEA